MKMSASNHYHYFYAYILRIHMYVYSYRLKAININDRGKWYYKNMQSPCKVRSEDVLLIFPTLVYRVHSAN